MNNGRTIKILYVDLHQDDPRKATMHKLERFGLATKVSPGSIRDSLVLLPIADTVLTNEDKWTVMRHGIVIIEGSWKRSGTLKKFKFRNSRRLPLLLAVNPVNYGKIGLLSSAEALSAALYISGLEDVAEKILSKFSWGNLFIKTNIEPLTEYSKCTDTESVEKIESEFFPIS